MRGIDIFSCQTLRNLELSNAWFLGQWLEDVSSGFPPLESLVLLRFRQMVVIRWRRHNDQHRQLVFCGCDHGAGGCVVKAKINTPNLLSLAYIFPEDVTNRYSSPLPLLEHPKVVINSSAAGRDSDLKDSLRWMAPALLGSLYINDRQIFADCWQLM
ncbi:hypothetical protein C1H46_039379 [Malus baccata]|uniref:Uncharacterized protein n=1 Tax=Malus baccata TaxID=106549 RepID=A0A540KLK1_MALBA|nr:hypothetical protein C1H46_039379 [Malus baccata]